MAKELYEIEKQTKDLNVKNLSQSEDIAQANNGDTIKTNSPPPEFITFVVLISAALLFVASIYYGIINP